MNLDTGKFLISRDVVFHEDIFPFTTHSPSLPIFSPTTFIDSFQSQA